MAMFWVASDPVMVLWKLVKLVFMIQVGAWRMPKEAFEVDCSIAMTSKSCIYVTTSGDLPVANLKFMQDARKRTRFLI